MQFREGRPVRPLVSVVGKMIESICVSSAKRRHCARPRSRHGTYAVSEAEEQRDWGSNFPSRCSGACSPRARKPRPRSCGGLWILSVRSRTPLRSSSARRSLRKLRIAGIRCPRGGIRDGAGRRSPVREFAKTRGATGGLRRGCRQQGERPVTRRAAVSRRPANGSRRRRGCRGRAGTTLTPLGRRRVLSSAARPMRRAWTG